MAGFSCSAILTLYLTAIVFLQGADLSLETKATQDLTMPSRSNSSGAAFNKPLRIISPHNEKSENTSQIQAKRGCANCSKNYNEKNGSDLHNLRIEMIKAKLLAKLQLEKEPVLKHKPKELRIAALLSNLNLIEEENDENEPEYDEDEYYGKTTQIILFSEKGRSQRFICEKIMFFHVGTFFLQILYIEVMAWSRVGIIQVFFRGFNNIGSVKRASVKFFSYISWEFTCFSTNRKVQELL